MKLLDLLKSLNNGATTDPNIESKTTDADRARLLDELNLLLELLAVPESQAAITAHPALPSSKSLLNIAAIFDGTAHPIRAATDDIRTLISNSSLVPPLQAKPPPPRQLVKALLEELLPLLAAAAEEPLDVPDNDTPTHRTQTLADSDR